MVFCFEIRGCFGGVRTVPHFGPFFRSRRAVLVAFFELP